MDLVLNSPALSEASSHESFFVGWPTKPEYSIVKNHFAAAELIFAIADGEVVGLITALTDKVLFAFIPLLEVRSDFQNQGIGSALLSAMESHIGSIYGIDLVCDPELVSFYRSNGFIEVSGMVKRDRQAL